MELLRRRSRTAPVPLVRKLSICFTCNFYFYKMYMYVDFEIKIEIYILEYISDK